jgi:hypothetical protein
MAQFWAYIWGLIVLFAGVRGLLALGPIKGPVAGGDASVKTQYNGAGEHMKGVLVHPLVPVALVEFVAICGMTEEARPLTDFGTNCVVEASESAGSKFGPVRALKLVENGGPFRAGPGDGSDAIIEVVTGFGAFKAAKFTASTAVLGGSGKTSIDSCVVVASEACVACGTIVASETSVSGGAVGASIACGTVVASEASASGGTVVACGTVVASEASVSGGAVVASISGGTIVTVVASEASVSDGAIVASETSVACSRSIVVAKFRSNRAGRGVAPDTTVARVSRSQSK